MALWQRTNQLKAELEKQRKLADVYRRLYEVQCQIAEQYAKHADRWRWLAARLLELRQ